MIYKFKSTATGDLIMLGADGDALLGVLGRPASAQGIIDVAAMPAAIAALEAAIAADEAPKTTGARAGAGDDEAAAPAVGKRQRLWPMIDMLRRAHEADAAVVWGV